MVRNSICGDGISTQISWEGWSRNLNGGVERRRKQQKLRADKELAVQLEWARLDGQKSSYRRKRRDMAGNLETMINVEGRANAQRAMRDAEEKRAGARDEYIEREEDAKHSTKAKHYIDRMREHWAHNLMARFVCA